MSLLAPLYLLGALAVSLPVLFHLIRRTPRGRQPFSSLMFLSPSPPRITRRSRIQHWLLLLLRAAAVILLALAFCRPFLRETATLMLDSGPGERVALLVDTSASMRRGDLWRQVVARTERILENLGPADEIGLFAYDDALRMVVDWDEPLPDVTARRARVRNGLSELSPTWGRSNLGQALATVADRLSAELGDRRDDRPSRVIVISDLQHGTDTSTLQAFEWPQEILLETAVLAPSSASNAHVRLLSDENRASREDDEGGWRVRVSNASGAASEQFQVRWAGSSDAGAAAEEVSVYVPAGQSRVIRLSEPPPGADRVVLVGDDHSFDNEYFFSPVHQRSVRVAFVGQEMPDDPQGLRYFLERVWIETPQRKVAVRTLTPAEEWDRLTPQQDPLVVVAMPLEATQLERLRQYVRAGGTALLVAADSATAAALASLAEGVRHLPPDVSGEPSRTDYALLTEIDFRHPVFASLAGPRYNDFTKVRFWKHQRFQLDEAAHAHVLARFDNGDPAVWEQSLERGHLLWFAGGWRPSESQLALSSKFVPLLSRVLDHLIGVERQRDRGWLIGQAVPLHGSEGAAVSLTRPDGSVVAPSSESPTLFRETTEPGIYHWQSGTVMHEFAVNLDPGESDTSPLASDHLLQLGVRVGRQPTREEQMERQRQMRDTELEARQKLWRWLLVGVLGILGLETIWAGWLGRRETGGTAAAADGWTTASGNAPATN
ncbi:MAG: BatA domain-containing protein [Pirellulaceae bacterium]